jgi:hypothetical protein
MAGGNVRYVSLIMLLMIAAAAEFHPCRAFKVDPYQSGLLVPRMYELASAPPMLPARIPSRYVSPTLPGEGVWYWKDMPTGEGGQPIIFKLEIEVSQSEHTLKLIGRTEFGRRDVLYECKVGLGASDFPTPDGSYYVTRIYDEAPWWIPPPSPWAWGESPSQRVYGGTMAPLLKKSFVSLKNQQEDTEDMIAGPVKLDDSGYRFHGTNAPRSIGHNESHGCVRMLPKDANRVAALIKEHVGTSENSRSVNGKFVVLRSPVRLNLVR